MDVVGDVDGERLEAVHRGAVGDRTSTSDVLPTRSATAGLPISAKVTRSDALRSAPARRQPTTTTRAPRSTSAGPTSALT